MKLRPPEESLMYPPLEQLLEHIPLKFELVLAATRRAKQIIRQARLNPAASELETKGRKPLSVALEDIMAGRIDMQSLMTTDLELDVAEEEELDMFPDLPYPEREREDGFGADEHAADEADDDDEDDGTSAENLEIDSKDLNWEITDD